MRAISFGILALALVAGGRWVGWWTLIALGLAGIGFLVVDRHIDASPTPEWRIGAAWLISQSMIIASIALTGGPRSPAITWLVIPMVTLPARFGVRGVIAGAVTALIALLAVTVGIDPAAVAANPVPVIFALALMLSVMVLSIALMQSDLQYRSAAVIDALTGMLNRSALATRVAELTEQVRFQRQPVALIIADLDHFKRVNDTHGHATGDAVLQEVAYRIRAQLRAYDLAYRLGGEEFLVLLPGATEEQATAIAETLREAIEAQPIAGLHVTMSLGVGASPQDSFHYDAVFELADAALYEAKTTGRNRVGGSAAPAALPGVAGAPPARDAVAL